MVVKCIGIMIIVLAFHCVGDNLFFFLLKPVSHKNLIFIVLYKRYLKNFQISSRRYPRYVQYRE
jgi:hypothetical protein